MATVSTSTASVRAEVSYVCSACGTKNTQQVTIETSAGNTGKAEARLQKIMSELAGDDLSKRYTHANLKCRCSNCKHSEPWTNLNFYAQEILSMVCFLLGGICLLGDLADPYSSTGAACAVILFLIGTGIFAFKKIKGASSAKKIAKLPAESLPTIKLLRNAAPARDEIMARINDKMNNR